MMTLAHNPMMLHNCFVAKTKATGFSSPYDPRRTHRPHLAVFLRPYAMASFMGGDGGGAFGRAGSLGRRSANPAICRPPRLAAGRGATIQGGHNMANISHPAHSAQTFPITRKEARRAARLWFSGTPTVSLAQWRQQSCRKHCEVLPALDDRQSAFNEAFNQEIAKIIAGGTHHA